MNVNNREDALMMTRVLQGKSVEEGKNLIKKIAGIRKGCFHRTTYLEAGSDNNNSFWIYVKYSLLDNCKAVMTESIGLDECGIVATIFPTKEELVKAIKLFKLDIDTDQSESEIIDDLVEVIDDKFDEYTFFDNFCLVHYQWEVWPTEEDMVDWNELED